MYLVLVILLSFANATIHASEASVLKLNREMAFWESLFKYLNYVIHEQKHVSRIPHTRIHSCSLIGLSVTPRRTQIATRSAYEY